ncbi:hypothetical protein EUX98_g2385 [Antrodiella citrinella]|uniref:CBM1 domain-containing protein n=1 Tax=Antrodiella citrinella TaxID=2447956 RepID=A0A4V3XJ53_9APHY|nr:hypothetical protein EUX98_g2385 [Antrodiella citrinella]
MDDTSATIHPPYYILVSHTLQLNSLIPPPPTSFSHPIIEYHYADDSPHNLLPRSEGELVLVLDHSPTDGADFSARSLTREMAVTGLKVSEAPGAGVVDDGVKDHNMYVLETTVLSEEPLEEECQGPQNILARFKQSNYRASKMRSAAFVTVLACIVVKVTAQAVTYSQCGGIGWAGSTACVAGAVCTVLNPYYSQCLPGAAPPATPTPTLSPPSIPVPPITSDPSTAPSSTPTVSAPAPTGTQIRADQDPVYHLYLQSLADGKPMLGPETSSGSFTIGDTITLNNADGSTLFLNEDEGASTSYKSLTLDTTASTTDWGLEGDTIITTAPRQLNFLVCESSTTGYYDLYLQEGNDVPAGATCTDDISLHLPCLC